MLKDEKENDDSLRAQFGDKWSRVPSENLTAPLIQESGKYRGILQTASNADAIVRNKFEQNRRGIELLSMTEVDLYLKLKDRNKLNFKLEIQTKNLNLKNYINIDRSFSLKK